MKFLERYPRWVLTFAACLYLLPGTWLFPLVDRDEPRFSGATIEMMERGNYVVPYFNDQYRFDKPPLTYWWMQLHYRLVGISELGARLHSVSAAWLVALALYGFARRLKMEPRWALLAGLVWLSSLQVVIHGRVAVADMPLILGTTIALRGIWDYLFVKKQRSFLNAAFAQTYLGMAFAFLAKGPLALFIPILTLLGVAIFSRKCRTLYWKQLLASLLPGLLVCLAIIGAWGIPALLQTQGAYFNVGIGEHIVERGISSFNERFYIPGVYYLAIILIFFSPWVPALVPSLKATWRARKETPYAGFLLGWVASSFIIFAFYKTQLPHYILPSYPALALLAVGWLRSNQNIGFQLSYTLTRIALSVAILSLFVLGWIFNRYQTVADLGHAALWLSALLVVLLMASECVKRQRLLAAILCSLGSAFLFLPFAHNVRQAHLVVRLQSAHAQILKDAPNAYADGFGEPSLVWYSGRFWNFQAKPNADALQSGDVLLVNTRRWRLDDRLISDWQAGDPLRPRNDLRAEIQEQYGHLELQTVQGFNPGNSSWIELTLIHKP